MSKDPATATAIATHTLATLQFKVVIYSSDTDLILTSLHYLILIIYSSDILASAKHFSILSLQNTGSGDKSSLRSWPIEA